MKWWVGVLPLVVGLQQEPPVPPVPPASPAPGVRETVMGLEVQGSREFAARTREALELLAGSKAFREAKPYVAVIRQAPRSGMRAYDPRPTYEVGEATWRHSAIWYAGTIAHDAYHSRLYHEAKRRGREPEAEVWTGKAAERTCLRFQARVLEELRADRKLVDYVRGLEKDPSYQGDSRSWADYRRRNW